MNKDNESSMTVLGNILYSKWLGAAQSVPALTQMMDTNHDCMELIEGSFKHGLAASFHMHSESRLAIRYRTTTWHGNGVAPLDSLAQFLFYWNQYAELKHIKPLITSQIPFDVRDLSLEMHAFQAGFIALDSGIRAMIAEIMCSHLQMPACFAEDREV